MSLDTYLKQAEVTRVDFIKLDVDGRECEALEGAQQCLEKFGQLSSWSLPRIA
jgi:FkbM family methyltransferase